MPVMMSKNTEDKGSSRYSKGISKLPEVIHEKTGIMIDFTDELWRCRKAMTEITNETSTESEATLPLRFLLIFLPKKLLNKNPIRGKTGISAISVFINTTNFLICLKGPNQCF
jgi:hypothetical protein